MTWATEAETLTYTGITVSTSEVQQAQFMIELFADVTEDANVNISSKNLRMLKMAVAYQAAWISDHPDVFTHVDVRTVLQDGIQFSDAHANAMVLAPMAKRAIDRLSWRRDRSIKIRPSKRMTNRGIRQIEYMGQVSSLSNEGNAFDSSSDGGAWEDE